jgi:hypothetical protein
MTDSNQTLIGITGRKGSGKDTVAQVLFDQGFENIKFAGALKAMTATLLSYQGVDAETIERMIEGDLKEVETEYLAGRTPRHVMQTLGTEWGRKQIDEDLWVHTALNRANSVPKAVITDVRFPNECEAVQKRNAPVIRVAADGIATPSAEDTHESEAHIDHLPVDAEFRNDHSRGVSYARITFAAFLARQFGEG